MAEKVLPGPVDSTAGIKEAVCVHTRKIFDSCRDSDCIEDLTVIPTRASVAPLLAAASIRPRCSELLNISLQVNEICFNRGFYTVDVRYYYKIRGEAYPSSLPVEGLAVFDKRVILFGSEGGAKQFSSADCDCLSSSGRSELPIAVADAVDPIALRMNLADNDEPVPADAVPPDIPVPISDAFDDELDTASLARIWTVSLGQFSMIRLERDVQLLMPSYDYCMPEKECMSSSEDDPCTLFGRIRFPLEEFYPPDALPACDCGSYREAANTVS